jgi:hypothetical protein
MNILDSKTNILDSNPRTFAEWLQDDKWEDEVLRAVDTKKYLKISKNTLVVTSKSTEQVAPTELLEFIKSSIPTVQTRPLCKEIQSRIQRVLEYKESIADAVVKKIQDGELSSLMKPAPAQSTSWGGWFAKGVSIVADTCASCMAATSYGSRKIHDEVTAELTTACSDIQRLTEEQEKKIAKKEDDAKIRQEIETVLGINYPPNIKELIHSYCGVTETKDTTQH